MTLMTRFPVIAPAVAASIARNVFLAMLLMLAGCGKPASNRDAVSCRFADAEAPRCVEFVQLKSPDMRLAASAQCRQNGGTFGDACPTEDLLGICETSNDVSKASVFSHRSRAFYYGKPGSFAALNIGRTKAACSEGSWIDGKR